MLTSDEGRLTATLADLLEGTIAIHRADLQSVLAEAAREVCLGAEVTSVRQEATWSWRRSPTGAMSAPTCLNPARQTMRPLL